MAVAEDGIASPRPARRAGPTASRSSPSKSELARPVVCRATRPSPVAEIAPNVERVARDSLTAVRERRRWVSGRRRSIPSSPRARCGRCDPAGKSSPRIRHDVGPLREPPRGPVLALACARASRTRTRPDIKGPARHGSITTLRRGSVAGTGSDRYGPGRRRLRPARASGLRGLRERLDAAGASSEAGPLCECGYRLCDHPQSSAAEPGP
jgi:hypothetical protein